MRVAASYCFVFESHIPVKSSLKPSPACTSHNINKFKKEQNFHVHIEMKKFIFKF